MSEIVTDSNKPAHKSWIERLGQMMGGEPQDREDLLDIFREAEEKRLLDKYALTMLEGVLQVSEQRASDVMVPRKKMVVLNKDALLETVYPMVIESGHSRFPVITDDKSEVVGILLAKDLLAHALDNKEIKVEEIMRPVQVVPESKRLNVLLKDFRAKHNHMAIVVDEYGAVAGVVTIEDVLEQIVGDIEDEHDLPSDNSFFRIKEIKESVYHFGGRVDILKAEEMLQTTLKEEEDEYETVGGLAMTFFKRIPETGEEIIKDDLRFKIIDADPRCIKTIEIEKFQEA